MVQAQGRPSGPRVVVVMSEEVLQQLKSTGLGDGLHMAVARG